MVDRSRSSACRLRTHEEPAGGVLSAAGDRRRTAGNGSDRVPILVEPHARLAVAATTGICICNGRRYMLSYTAIFLLTDSWRES